MRMMASARLARRRSVTARSWSSTRRRCAERSTRSTSASTTRSTTASTAPASPAARRAYEQAFAELFDSFDWLEELLGAAALPARRAAHRGRLAPVPDARALRRGLQPALPLQPPAAGRLPEPLGLRARALPAAGRRADGRDGADQAPLLHDARRAEPEAHHPRRARVRLVASRTGAPDWRQPRVFRLAASRVRYTRLRRRDWRSRWSPPPGSDEHGTAARLGTLTSIDHSLEVRESEEPDMTTSSTDRADATGHPRRAEARATGASAAGPRRCARRRSRASPARAPR